MSTRAADLLSSRRKLMAAYAKARYRHAPRAILARKLQDLTSALLRAELRETKPPRRRRPQAAPTPDLFTL